MLPSAADWGPMAGIACGVPKHGNTSANGCKLCGLPEPPLGAAGRPAVPGDRRYRKPSRGA
jgi:hypothetical protein